MSCTCNRDYTHCYLCGAKGPYRQKFRSEYLTKINGTIVDAFLCRRCGQEFDTTMPCEAPAKLASRITNFKAESSNLPTQTAPTHVQKDSPEYLQLAQSKVLSLLKEGLTKEQALARMRLEGWVVELDTDSPKEHIVSGQSDTPMMKVEEHETKKAAPVSMGDIINAMKDKR